MPLFPRPFKRLSRALARWLPPVNFITVHYTYFIATCLVSAVIFWGSSMPARQVTFSDSIFLTTSSMTEAGLNTINLSTLNTFQQFIIFVLMMLGSPIFVSAFVVNIRCRAFEQKFKEVIEQQKLKRDRERKTSTNFLLLPFPRRNSAARPNENQPETEPKSPLSQGAASTSPGADHRPDSSDGNGANDYRRVEAGQAGTRAGQNKIKVTVDTAIQAKLPYKGQLAFSNADSRSEPNVINPVKSTVAAPPLGGTILQPQHKHAHSVLFSTRGVGARFAHIALPHIHQPSEELGSSSYLQNSETAHLSHLERLRLGGVEYGATRLLVWVVPAYFVLWQLFGCIGLGAWVSINRPDTARSNGLNPFWAGAFNAVSAFNNNGYSLIDANMTAFQTSDYMLITMSLMILAGNTCYPIFLRLIVWVFLKLTPEEWTEDKESLRFLLDHPRRCYTNLFPANDTWWLLLAVITLDGIDWAGFLVFNIGNQALQNIPLHSRVIDGLFQATAVRSGGFAVVGISSLRIGTQVLYTVMMYISAFPVAMTIRTTNVYEERSLGIYAEDIKQAEDTRTPGFWGGLRRRFSLFGRTVNQHYFLQQQLRAQLAHDLWWLVIAVLLIMLIETSQFESNPEAFSVFNVIFEVVSGYGCVGISIGVPWGEYSFCGSWHKLSKLILCAVMLRGRHRGLPILLDMAVLLPGERLDRAEEDDARIRLERTESRRGER